MIGVKEMYLFTMPIEGSYRCNRDHDGRSGGVGHTEAGTFNSDLDSAVWVIDDDFGRDGSAADENSIAVGVGR